MHNYTQAIAAIKRLIKVNMLQHIQGVYVYDATGIFQLDMDERENIKCGLLKPEMTGYLEFVQALEVDDDDAIGAFEEKAEAKMHELESDIALDMIQSI